MKLPRLFATITADSRPWDIGFVRRIQWGLNTVAVVALVGATGLRFGWKWLTLLPVLALAAVLTTWLMRRRTARGAEIPVETKVAQGVPVNAYVIPDLRLDTGMGSAGFCFALISFQPEVAADGGYLRWLARRVAEMREIAPRDPDGRFVAHLTTASPQPKNANERRRRLPISFTDGSLVYCVALELPTGFRGDKIACIAEPGDSGRTQALSPALRRSHPALFSEQVG